MVNRVVVPKSCRKNWIDKLIHRLKGVHIWIGPRGLRIGNLFENETDEFIAEVLANVDREIFDPRINP